MPIVAAAASPLLAWRDSVYMLACFAGIIALGLMLVQPLLIAGYLPGLSAYRGRRTHLWIGGTLVGVEKASEVARREHRATVNQTEWMAPAKLTLEGQ